MILSTNFYNFSILPPQSLAWLQKVRQGQASNLQDNGGHVGRDATGKVTKKKKNLYFLVLKIEITNKKYSSAQGCPVNLQLTPPRNNNKNSEITKSQPHKNRVRAAQARWRKLTLAFSITRVMKLYLKDRRLFGSKSVTSGASEKVGRFFFDPTNVPTYTTYLTLSFCTLKT